MSCTSCSTTQGSPKGCKNNGHCQTGGCSKLEVYDWLSNMQLPTSEEQNKLVEVRFKNERKLICEKPATLSVSYGDVLVIKLEKGFDVGKVSLLGSLVRVQLNKQKKQQPLLKIIRKATQGDIDIWQSCREKEEEFKMKSRELAAALKLNMKITDVEFQGDGKKATFYFTASKRIDFRQLIIEMAAAFKIKIEMHQIDYRQEASKLGGIGTCGRELCCSTWLTDFRKVSISAARYQQMALNTEKLSGQCGKFKCCLNYELDTYTQSLEKFPSLTKRLVTEKGEAKCQKIDVFKEILWYAYNNNHEDFVQLTLSEVLQIIELNKKQVKVNNLESYSSFKNNQTQKVALGNMAQESITRFDKKRRK